MSTYFQWLPMWSQAYSAPQAQVALAVLTVNTLSSFRHNCTAVSADDLVSAVAVVLVLEGAVGAGVAADTGAGLKNAGHIIVIDGAVLVDSVNVMMRSINHGVGSANFLRLGSAADASAVAVRRPRSRLHRSQRR